MRMLVFILLTLAFACFTVYGLASGDFAETISNGVTICLTCIGVA